MTIPIPSANQGLPSSARMKRAATEFHRLHRGSIAKRNYLSRF
jgi:hypothetical protein